jgi:acetyltransferase
VLDVFSDLQAVAITGASRTSGKLGHGVVQNVRQCRYTGAICPINPGAEAIM